MPKWNANPQWYATPMQKNILEKTRQGGRGGKLISDFWLTRGWGGSGPHIFGWQPLSAIHLNKVHISSKVTAHCCPVMCHNYNSIDIHVTCKDNRVKCSAQCVSVSTRHRPGMFCFHTPALQILTECWKRWLVGKYQEWTNLQKKCLVLDKDFLFFGKVLQCCSSSITCDAKYKDIYNKTILSPRWFFSLKTKVDISTAVSLCCWWESQYLSLNWMGLNCWLTQFLLFKELFWPV